MTCSDCGQENKGIKLNGKLYCTNCGAILESATEILEESYAKNSKKEDLPKKNKFDSKETEELEAEKDILDLIIKRNKNLVPKNIKFEKQTIEKKNRKRAAHAKGTPKKNSIYHLVAGEPDPIAEPELESPKDDLIESNDNKDFKETEIKYPLQTKEELAEIERKKKMKKDALGAYFKSKGEAATKKDHPKKSKRWGTKKKIVVATVIAFTVLFVGFVGLVFYVNGYALNTERIQKSIEAKPRFNYKKPGYVPAGYELTYHSEAELDHITYNYILKTVSKDERSLTISIRESNLTAEELFTEVVAKSGDSYTKKSATTGAELWILGNDKLVFVKDNLLYEITSSAIISSEELIKIAEGLI